MPTFAIVGGKFYVHCVFGRQGTPAREHVYYPLERGPAQEAVDCGMREGTELHTSSSASGHYVWFVPGSIKSFSLPLVVLGKTLPEPLLTRIVPAVRPKGKASYRWHDFGEGSWQRKFRTGWANVEDGK